MPQLSLPYKLDRPASSARALDQFYTRPEVAAWCVDLTLKIVGSFKKSEALYIEPSAGAGAFLDVLPHPRLGIDVAPAQKHAEIIKGDFLQWAPSRQEKRKIIVVGNPPFGKNASMALRFLNHAASFAHYVAFILPRTFEKRSLQARIQEGWELAYQAEMNPDSFLHEGLPYKVPVVFQIWKKTGLGRKARSSQMTHPDFVFVKKPSEADFAFQRVGARAGLVSKEGLKKSPQSHYFIKAKSKKINVMAILSRIDWTSIKHRTAGNPSIGKAELIDEYRKAVQ